MATDHLTGAERATPPGGGDAVRRHPNRKGRWYTPPAAVDQADHLKASHKPDYWGVVPQRFDRYHGTAEQLSAAGLLPLHMFPGQPGVGVARASYRPLGAIRDEARSWFWTPGFMEVCRNPGGAFTITLTVSLEEQERRAAMNQAERERREQECVARRIEDARRVPPAPAGRRQHLRLVTSSLTREIQPSSRAGGRQDEGTVTRSTPRLRLVVRGAAFPSEEARHG